MPRVHEQISRSFVKAVIFRVLVLISDGIVIFWITHRYDTTIEVVILSNFSSTFIYFLYERLWNKVDWGRVIKSQSSKKSTRRRRA